MRKFTGIIAMVLCAALLTGGCGVDNSAQNEKNQPVPTGNTVPGYISREIEYPEYVGSAFEMAMSLCFDSLGDSIFFASRDRDNELLLCVYDTVQGSWTRLAENVRNIVLPTPRSISALGGSVWLLVQGGTNYDKWYVVKAPISGAEADCTELPFSGDAGSESSSEIFLSLVAVDEDRALLTSPQQTFLIDKEANVLDRPQNLIQGQGLNFRVNDRRYFWVDKGSAPFQEDSLSFGEPIVFPEEVSFNQRYSSANGNVLLDADRAMCALITQTGELTELFKWEDTALSIESLRPVYAFENSQGNFFSVCSDCFIKISPGMVPVKKSLKMGCFGEVYTGPEDGSYHPQPAGGYFISDSLMDAVIRFNNQDMEFKIEIVPLTYSTEAERDRILMDIATGSDIELLDTSYLPERAAKGSLLMDMLPMLENEPDMSPDDFIPSLFNSMLKDGGLYEYRDRFTLLTLTTHRDFLPEGKNWTAAQLRDIIAAHPDMPVMRSNMDKELQLILMSWAATAEFIDWDKGSCSFDSPEFIEWLRLLKELPGEREYDPAQEGNIMEISWDAAGNADYLRGDLQSDYVFAGFPGSKSGGNYFLPLGSSPGPGYETEGQNTSVGIMASGKNHEGAWRFVKCLMQGSGKMDLDKGVPVFREDFERLLANCPEPERLSKDEYMWCLNSADAELFRELVYNSKGICRTDIALNDIITAEARAYLGGKGSAEDCAAQIQGRVSIYIAEQGA